MKDAHRILIGSLGDDIHSVGQSLLKIALQESGFFVHNLGIGNTIDQFFKLAPQFDAILISCINGHVDLFLEEFAHKLSQFQLSDSEQKVWYLGGNLSVKEDEDKVIRKYLQMGFDYVAAKPVSWQIVVKQLHKDFSNREIPKKNISLQSLEIQAEHLSLDLVHDEPMTDIEFNTIRSEVLGSWPTGAAVLTADIKANHSDKSKNLSRLLRTQQQRQTYPLKQPRTGVAHVEDEIEILQYLEEHGSDIASIQLDAASRKNMYKKAEEGVLRTDKGKISFLNGYPVPIHGVPGIEKILHTIKSPFQIRAGSPDHRLIYEIGLAGGATSVEGGFICYLFPYDKTTSPITCLQYWKYVDKLAAWYYQEYGIIINREYFGPLTTSLIEPTIPICINIIQSVLSAKAGVKCISVSLAEQGNRSQDIAAIQTLLETTQLFLNKYGLKDCNLSTVFHQYMAAFPTSLEKASNLIVGSSTTAALSMANKVMIKTPVESFKIPNRQDNANALQLTQTGFEKATELHIDHNVVNIEKKFLKKQVIAIMNYIEVVGNGSLAKGALIAFEKGILDIPFSPSKFNLNKLLTARDADGAIRFINPEHLPFDEETKEFHTNKIHHRKVLERVSKTTTLLEQDLTRISKNEYLKWPLDGTYIS